MNSSYLWDECKVMRLTQNMRLLSMKNSADADELRNFTEWISGIGDRTLDCQCDNGTVVTIPRDLLFDSNEDHVKEIVDEIYPNFLTSVDDPNYLQQRDILAPTLESVDSINEYMISLNGTESKIYLSSYSAAKSDFNVDILADVHTPEFLNSIKYSGLRNHELILKDGTPVMLLRNLYHARGLCNETRMVITKLGDRVLQAKVLTGNSAGQCVLIPRLTLTPADSRIPFRFKMRQFPMIVSYAMSINKSQRQSLNYVGIYLKRLIFGHGQLYVAVSRVTNRKGLKIMLCDKKDVDSSTYKNVVFREAFRNL